MRILRHETGHAIDNAYPASATAAAANRSSVAPQKRYPAIISRGRTAAISYCISALVRAEPSGRGLRRNLCGMADARARWRERYHGWPALKKLVLCRRADGGDRFASGRGSRARHGRSARRERRCASTTRKARAYGSAIRAVRPRSDRLFSDPNIAAPIRRRHSSSAASARVPGLGGAMDGRVPVHDQPVIEEIARCRELNCAPPAGGAS